MKGNKFERSVLELSREMGGIDNKCYEWLLSTIKEVAYVSGNKVICLECGHEFTSESCNIDGTIECPVCHKKLKIEWTRKKAYDNGLFSAITNEYKGFQVIRYFWIQKWKNNYSDGARNYVSEVMQIWVDENGKKVYLAKPLKMFPNSVRNPFRESVYDPDTDTYKDSDLEIRRPLKGTGYCGFNISNLGYSKLKIISLAKFLKQRGVKKGIGSFPYNYYFDDFIELILSPLAEVMYKKGMKKLLLSFAHDKFWQKDEDLSKRIQALKIALRHKYFETHKLYDKQDNRIGHEYERVLYSDWSDLIDQIIRMGLDYRSPKYVCPENLRELHNTLLKKENKKKDEETKLEKLERNRKMNNSYIEARKKFFNINLVDEKNKFSIQVLKSVDDFYEEAERMHHCVYENKYYDMERHPNSLILSARVGEDWNNPEKRLETIEINLETYTIIQSRAVNNGVDKLHNKILALILQNMDFIQRIDKSKKSYKAA